MRTAARPTLAALAAALAGLGPSVVASAQSCAELSPAVREFDYPQWIWSLGKHPCIIRGIGRAGAPVNRARGSRTRSDLSMYARGTFPGGGAMDAAAKLVGRAGRVLPLLVLALASPPAAAQAGPDDWPPTDYGSMSGSELYGVACAACHGADGSGLSSDRVGFQVPLPDFSDCSFASREPDADWIAVAHEGGPVRGFDRAMPAFGAALSVDELQRAMDYIRTLCGDGAWPPGELNLPRAMVTEKAYPEDEAVFTYGAALGGPGVHAGELVYEKRFGARNQVELVVPFSYRARGDAASWAGGLGDLVLGVKRALHHDLERGSIVAAAAEIKLPTGDYERGFGSGTPVWETFVSYGQILPNDAFLQFQGVFERPFDLDRASEEAALRFVLGRSFTEGTWGRTWSPMVEVLGSRALDSGATTHWDLLPQFQVTLNTRQHVMANLGVRFPLNDTASREPQLLVYLLWDWFDGGFSEGW